MEDPLLAKPKPEVDGIEHDAPKPMSLGARIGAIAAIVLLALAGIVYRFLTPKQVDPAEEEAQQQQQAPVAAPQETFFKKDSARYALQIPDDLNAVALTKLPAKAQKALAVPPDSESVIVAAPDGTFTGMVVGGKPLDGASGLDVLSLKLGNVFEATSNPELVPPDWKKRYLAWSFDLTDGTNKGAAHIAKTDDGRAYAVLGWGPSAMEVQTTGRIAALFDGLEIDISKKK